MKSALIVGMAKSGIGAAKLLSRQGWRVLVNDMKPEVPGLTEALKGYDNIEFHLGEDPGTLLEGLDLVIPSPIIPMTKPFLVRAREMGIETISEIELGYRFSRADFVCITGTNGKTTCTALTGELFKAGYTGGNTYVLGNIGVAITEHALDTKPGDVVVAETAALQLEGDKLFHARAAAVCNITEDHLDHFGTMENYIAAKCKIFDHQTEADFAVLNFDDPVVREMTKLTRAHVLYFSRLHPVEEGMFLRDGRLIYKTGGRETALLKAEEIFIPGDHNLENAMLSSLLALSMGISPRVVNRVLRDFRGVEHRIEYVREVDGVTWYNDSKGTNPASTMRAIQAMRRKTVLILGGFDKHSDFHELFGYFGDTVKAVVVLGQTSDKIIAAAKDCGYDAICHRAETFEETLALCRKLAVPGDAVLLSPACASWGMFDNYEQRGRIFKELVNAF